MSSNTSFTSSSSSENKEPLVVIGVCVCVSVCPAEPPALTGGVGGGAGLVGGGGRGGGGGGGRRHGQALRRVDARVVQQQLSGGLDVSVRQSERRLRHLPLEAQVEHLRGNVTGRVRRGAPFRTETSRRPSSVPAPASRDRTRPSCWLTSQVGRSPAGSEDNTHTHRLSPVAPPSGQTGH